ncbi:IMP dehydrogenase [Achromatium sp. WMS2]|nr:IMP dehydrogenase [Achromatium sp. WMS2]
MTIHISIQHKTEYRYERPVGVGPHIIRLRPAPHCRTPILAYSLKVHPKKHFLNWQQDPFGNWQARLVFPERTSSLIFEVSLVAEMITVNPFDFFLDDTAKSFPFKYPDSLRSELLPYLSPKELGPKLTAWLAEVDLTARSTVDFLVDLNRRLQQDIGYVIRMEPGVQTCEKTLDSAKGSCRDTAYLLVQILRHLGLAARFVSGYLVQLAPDQKPLDGPAGPSQDFTDLHAWAEVYVQGAGWLGLDPTSGLFAGEGHIPLACTPDPASAAPITGVTEKCEAHFSFYNQVSRIKESPRVTKPYTENQWQSILRLGEEVDRVLNINDVRLTMGGEPTFVSIDNMDGAEWNTQALGPHKRRLADQLARRLRQRFAPGGLLHFGQGKWYPGEPLPRWAINCYWRRDNLPVWNNPELFATEVNSNHHSIVDSEQFANTLATHLGVDPSNSQPAYEDIFYYMWREGRLPINVNPLDSKLKNPLERNRLRRLFQRGLEQTVGFVLPLRWTEANAEPRWKSGRWSLRDGVLFLIPGDSPMGLRLPLDALPWSETDKDEPITPDPFAPQVPLQNYRDVVAKRYTKCLQPVDSSEQESIRDQLITPESDTLIRTALCIEPRDGRIHIFLPPLTQTAAFLDLIASIEATALELSIPVVIEGYDPPKDSRLLKLSVTPDPGVIEVNVQPASSWSEMVEITEALYEDAHQSRLGTEKFMLDGRHTGTGGGNHVTLGALRAEDSPLLRRPDLLRSLISYWQNHPSLSYLFSGLFVGPTSQAPRVDEARDESLYELEIAFSQISYGEVPAPWLVDRILRNLLADSTGNTHRTEFCIDKLYSPDGPSGRQGLVEFRAFEMPPHPRMSLVQMLLLRALVAYFWRTPYSNRLIRWGTELHDRFMLPHFVWQDIGDVIRELKRAGYNFDLQWLAPFFEFRFPRYGNMVAQNGIELELRPAIEPWNVLAEEVTSQGTARFVDSSVERLQIKVNGMTENRYLVTCNGRRVPLRPTGRRGELVAGIRFKAWQPPSGLHPNIPAQNPLVFDLLDTWNRCSLGGCTYYVAHPGGRSYDTFPINANEAESRRIARFRTIGHTPGAYEPPAEEPTLDYPYTLDLRK